PCGAPRSRLPSELRILRRRPTGKRRCSYSCHLLASALESSRKERLLPVVEAVWSRQAIPTRRPRYEPAKGRWHDVQFATTVPGGQVEFRCRQRPVVW